MSDTLKPITSQFPLTDSGNAERLVAYHGADLRYCHGRNLWLLWNGRYWEPDAKSAILQRAKDTARRIPAEAAGLHPDGAKRLLDFARQSEGKARLKAMIDLASAEPKVAVTSPELDRDRLSLNVANGTLDLRSGKLGAHRREDLITRQLAVPYYPEAECPLWLAFLDRITGGDRELVAFLQRAVGYALTGDTSEQCFFLLIGSGANGKSTFLEVIRRLLGGYAVQADFSTFLQQQNDRVRNDLAALNGARFVVASEAGEDRNLDEVLIKQVTGGEPLRCRFLFKEHFEFLPEFKLFLGANHKPNIRGTDYGIWRRIKPVPLNVTIPAAERDPHLLDKLLEEGEGILSWAVQGCLEWQGQRLNEPLVVQEAAQTYQMEMDLVGRFITDCCISGPLEKASAAKLFQAFKHWCSQNGEETPSQKMFGSRLAGRGLQRARGTGNRWHWNGISLK